MVELHRGSSGLDVSGLQPNPITGSEDWCWGASAVASLPLYGLGTAHLSSKVVVYLLDGSSGS